MIGAVAAILVFVAALVFIMFSTVFSGSFQGGNTKRVPTVTGLLYSEASVDTNLLGDFTLETRRRRRATSLRYHPLAGSYRQQCDYCGYRYGHSGGGQHRTER